MNRRQKIAVIGSGAVGTYYGARLAHNQENNVWFLARTFFDRIKENGIYVASPNGDIKLSKPHVAKHPKEIGTADWILVALKSYSIPVAMNLVRHCVAENTRIIVAMNGLGVETPFAESFGPEKIFGAIPFIAANRDEKGRIIHVKYNGIDIGHYLNDQTENSIVEKLWIGSRVDTTISQCLLKSRWCKLLFNFPFNGISVANKGLPIDQITKNPRLRVFAREIMEELLPVANKDLTMNKENEKISPEYFDKVFGMLDVIGPYKTSSTVDFLDGKPLELEYMFSKPLEIANKYRMSCPKAASLFEMVVEASLTHRKNQQI